MEENYKFSLKQALEGWGRLTKIKLGISKLSEKEKKVVNDRLVICHNCDKRIKGNICGECGCFIPAKVLVIKQKCKLKKW